MKEKLKEFISIAKSKKIEVEVYSNLTILDEKLIEFLQKLDVHLATSFYSFDEETHEKITQRPGSFQRTVQNIKKALEKGIKLRIGIVLTELNKNHLRQTSKFLNDLGISKNNIKVDFARPVGRWVERALSQDPSPSQVQSTKPSDYEICKISDSCLPDKLCFASDGFVHPCIFFRHIILGKYPENSVEQILENQRKFIKQHKKDIIKQKKEIRIELIKKMMRDKSIRSEKDFMRRIYQNFPQNIEY